VGARAGRDVTARKIQPYNSRLQYYIYYTPTYSTSAEGTVSQNVCRAKIIVNSVTGTHILELNVTGQNMSIIYTMNSTNAAFRETVTQNSYRTSST